VINPTYVGAGVDQDGDGFSDKVEKEFGSDPLRSTNTPFFGQPATFDRVLGKIIFKSAKLVLYADPGPRQRTAAYVVPAHNAPLDAATLALFEGK